GGVYEEIATEREQRDGRDKVADTERAVIPVGVLRGWLAIDQSRRDEKSDRCDKTQGVFDPGGFHRLRAPRPREDARYRDNADENTYTFKPLCFSKCILLLLWEVVLTKGLRLMLWCGIHGRISSGSC